MEHSIYQWKGNLVEQRRPHHHRFDQALPSNYMQVPYTFVDENCKYKRDINIAADIVAHRQLCYRTHRSKCLMHVQMIHECLLVRRNDKACTCHGPCDTLSQTLMTISSNSILWEWHAFNWQARDCDCAASIQWQHQQLRSIQVVFQFIRTITARWNFPNTWPKCITMFSYLCFFLGEAQVELMHDLQYTHLNTHMFMHTSILFN